MVLETEKKYKMQFPGTTRFLVSELKVDMVIILSYTYCHLLVNDFL